MKRMKRFISMLLAILILNLFIVQPIAAFQETTSLPMFQDNLETFISQSDISQLITPSAITSVSGDYISPNDIHSSQWAIEKINANSVWEFNYELLIHNNEVEVVVAVIDTGVDYTHEDLVNRVKMENGNVKGYNAITREKSGFMDDSLDSHGTMVAGVIAAETDNGKGIEGVAGSFNIKIMPVKALNANGNADIGNVADAIKWSADNGANIINLSMGEWFTYDSYPADLSDAVDYACNKGVLVVAAAGNNGENIKQAGKAYYPACLPNVLSVGSVSLVDSNLQHSDFTNTGAKIYAPGENIYSTKIGNTYGVDKGTSLAAAHVSGAAALLSFFMKAAPMTYNYIPVNHATLINSLVTMSSEGNLDVLTATTYTSPSTFFDAAILTPDQDADVSETINITTQVTGYNNSMGENDYNLGYFILQYKPKDDSDVDASYTDIKKIQIDNGDFSKYSVNWDTTQLSNGEYTIRAMYYESDDSLITVDSLQPPMIDIIIANSSIVPEIAALRLNAPRKNINGSLYMGDTTVIELISTKTGLAEPQVTVSYDEWNEAGDVVENKTKILKLIETPAGSKRYTADFILTEGICKITTLTGQLAPDISKTANINLNVAGRLKAMVERPVRLDDAQIKIYNDILSDSFVIVKSETNNDFITSNSIDSNTFIIEGLDVAADYELNHYDVDNLMISQNSISEYVKNGLETDFQYKIENLPSNIKVKVVDDATGLPIGNVRVTSSPVTFLNSQTAVVSAVTGKDGYAATAGSYFTKNALMDSNIELTTKFQSISSNLSDWYGNETVSVNSLAIGDNEIQIRLTKVKEVTLEGTVTDHNGIPLKGVYVSISQSIGNSPFINTSSTTDDNGSYSMKVSNIGGTVSFSIDGNVIKEKVELAKDINKLDMEIEATKPSTVKVVLETIDQNGFVTKMDLERSVNIGMHLFVKNESKGMIGTFSVTQPSIYNVKGNPGDNIQVTADGYDYGYDKGSATTVLDENNKAEVKLILKQLGSVNANVIDKSGDGKLGEYRHMYIYDDEGYYVRDVSSANPYISCALPDGEYKAVISWKYNSLRLLSSWEDNPNCIITDSFIIENGKPFALGIKYITYYEDSYFDNDETNSFGASHNHALPGTVITLRATYDYDNNNANPIDIGKLDLVAQIPFGTTLIPNTVFNRVTRGNIGISKPEIVGNSIILDLKDGIKEGVSGVLTYQVKVDNPLVYENIMANAEMEYIAGTPRSETIGSVIIPTNLLTLNAPSEVVKANIGIPVNLSGLAPENSIVELYDGNIKIGEAKAEASGVWASNVSLPDRGTPIYHFITAKVMIGGKEHTDMAEVLVGLDKVVMTEFTLSQASRSFSFDPRDGFIWFPFSKGTEDFVASVTFSDGDRVENVKIDRFDAVQQGDEYYARIPENMLSLLNVEYDEPKVEEEKILRFDHGQPPILIEDAETEFLNGTAEDIKLEYGADGYIKSFRMPEIKMTAQDETVVSSMQIETVSFDTEKAKNRTDLGGGIYGYDFSYEFVDGKYIITAYIDRRLIEKPSGFQANKQTTIRAAKSALEVAKITIGVASDGNSLLNTYGDFSKAGRMMDLTRKFNECGANSFNSDYYAEQIDMMNRDIYVSKALGLTASVVAKAAEFVPLLGQVVVELSELVAGKLLDNMFDNEFEYDYNRIMSMLNNEPGSIRNDISNRKRVDYGDYWWNRDRVANVVWIRDPSGFVYEAVEDNRIEGVITTVLFLDKDEALDAATAKESDKWQVWDAEWFLQENPQLTGDDGRYAWDVPEGWWMVQCVKDGYLTAYSDALPVPPPQFDINIPMTNLNRPTVEKVVWGNGGRYVDVYFSKYMNVKSFTKTNAISVVDLDGNDITGTAISAIPQKLGVNGLNLTKIVRFIPGEELTVGESYTLTVNKDVTDYADFTMKYDCIKSDSIPASAPIAKITGADLTVEPSNDITQTILEALEYIADEPNNQDILDTRVIFDSSNNNVVKFMEDGTAVSVGEGTAQITVTSIDDTSKTAVFTITSAYPPRAVNVTHMAIKDNDENLLLDLSIREGEKYILNVIISPSDASNKNVVYASDNTSSATVNQSGVIEGVAEGIAIVTAKTEDQGIRQKIFVTVLPRISGGSNSGKKVPIVEKPTDVFEFKFTDVKETDWFYEAVRALAEKGIAKGISETKYAPFKTVTRAEFITMLCRTYGIEARTGENFADAGDNWYTGYLAAAKQLGISQGVGNNRFDPMREITREEMVVMLYNYFKSINEVMNTESVLSYNDKDKVSDWAMEAVVYAAAKGWIKGRGNNDLVPQGTANRAELAQILYNLYNIQGYK